ncbi:MAG: hypothetical protein HY809_03110 [Nitrospirae bacterium]|nr:hypothetical protein [Nitrospirota bacterium]
MSKTAILSSILWLAIIGCTIPFGSGAKSVPVQEADNLGISLARIQNLKRGEKEEAVTALLGKPADRRQSCLPGEVIWRYPIRAWNDMIALPEVVPAAILRVNFDSSGIVAAWGFVDAITGRSLQVRESLNKASRWFRSISPPPAPPYIELQKVLLIGRASRADVEKALGQWQPDLFCGYGGPVPIVKKNPVQSGEIWDWYVDRPSPLFIPPRYLVVTFDDKGSLIAWHFERTYPGGKK